MLRSIYCILIFSIVSYIFAVDTADSLFRELRHAENESERARLRNEIRQKFPESKYAALLELKDKEFSAPDAEYKELYEIRKILRKWPDFPEAYLLQGFIKVSTRSKATAEDDYDKFRKSGLKENYYETVMGGIIYLKIEKFAPAIVKFNQAVLMRPNEFEPYYWRGQAYLGLEKSLEAVRDFTTCLGDMRRPEMRHGCFSNRGEAHLKLRQFAEAYNDFKAAETLSPNESDDSTGMAQALQGLKRYDEAELAALASIKVNPKDALAFLILAVLSDKKGNCKDAKNYIEKQRAVRPLVFAGHKFTCPI